MDDWLVSHVFFAQMIKGSWTSMKVFLDFASDRHHTLYDELIDYPPQGIEYQISSGKMHSTRLWGLGKSIYTTLPEKAKPILKDVYVSALNFYINAMSKNDENVELVHVCNTFIAARKNRPWVLDIENIGPSTTGGDLSAFRLLKRKIEKVLSSKYCKKIMPWTNTGKKTIETFLDVKNFKDKIEVVYPAMHIPPQQPKYEDGKITMLFVGSITNPRDFFFKGGEYALKCFEILSKKYDVQLIVRSAVPKEIKEKYQKFKDLVFVENVLPKNELYKLYAKSDVSLFPGHTYSLMATLESMAFGLPLVTIDGVANAEFVEHGKTGFLAKPSKHILTDPIVFCWVAKKMHGHRILVDPIVVNELTQHLAALVENDSLRKEMGKQAKKRIENGDFSIKVRNQKLKRIYEKAAKK